MTGQFGPALDELRALIAEGDEELLSALDRAAAEAVTTRRADQVLGPFIESLIQLSYRDHPWAQLSVAAAVWDALSHRREKATDMMLAAAREFRARGDKRGQGYAALVRGNFALGQGKLTTAARWWRLSRKLLDEESPAQHQAISSLALGAYQRGDLFGSCALAEEALAVARIHRDLRTEGMTLTYIAFICLNRGELLRAEWAIRSAEAAFRQMPDSQDRVELPIVLGARGVLWSFRGEARLADRSFTEGIKLADAIDFPWFAAIVKAARAEFTGSLDPERAETEARSAYETLKTLGDEWFSTWALRAQAVVARETGNFTTSREILVRLVALPLNPCEMGIALLRLGQTQLMSGACREAAASLHQAANLLESCGANYWLAETLVTLAQADPAQMSGAITRVKQLVDDEAVCEHLFRSRGRLRITVLGAPAVSIDGEGLDFSTQRAELLVYLLAMAAPRGLHWDELAERLWPETPRNRAAGRLRTALWEARKVLAGEGWRLTRQDELVRLNLNGARLDVRDALRAARSALSLDESYSPTEVAHLAQEALDALRLEILPRWEQTAVAGELAAEIAAVIVRLESMTAPAE